VRLKTTVSEKNTSLLAHETENKIS